MKRLISISLLLSLITFGLPANTYAATDGCPDSWILKFEPNQEWLKRRGAMGVNDFPDFFNETTGTLAAAMVPIGINFTTDGIGGLNMYQAFTV